MLASPQGEFGDVVDLGGGFALQALLTPPGGMLGLRLDAGWLIYGSETIRRPLARTEDRVFVDTAYTDNSIGHVSVGPQVMAPAGRVRPYAHGFAGFSYFSTDSQPAVPGLFGPRAYTTHLDDFTFSYGGGAGAWIFLGSGGGLALDLGARYVRNGRVDYLVEGDIRRDENGRTTFQPRRSDGNLVEFRLGLVFRP